MFSHFSTTCAWVQDAFYRCACSYKFYIAFLSLITAAEEIEGKVEEKEK